MIRDKNKPISYFDKWIRFNMQQVDESLDLYHSGKVADPAKVALLLYGILRRSRHLLLMRYSRGDDQVELYKSLVDGISRWSVLSTYLTSIQSDGPDLQSQYEGLDFDNYYSFFCMLSFAVNLKTDDEQQDLVISLIGNEGKDRLLDQVIARCDPARKVAEQLLFPRLYRPLNDALESPKRQIDLISKFLNGWYDGCKRAYWHDSHLGDDRGYFGYWCVEAAAVVRLWNIDDSSFSDHPHYPRDLIRMGK